MFFVSCCFNFALLPDSDRWVACLINHDADCQKSDSNGHSYRCDHCGFLVLEAPHWDSLCQVFLGSILGCQLIHDWLLSSCLEISQLGVFTINENFRVDPVDGFVVIACLHWLISVMEWPLDGNCVCLRELICTRIWTAPLFDKGVWFSLAQRQSPDEILGLRYLCGFFNVHRQMMGPCLKTGHISRDFFVVNIHVSCDSLSKDIRAPLQIFVQCCRVSYFSAHSAMETCFQYLTRNRV